MENINYNKYSKKEFLKILDEDGILFVETSLGNRCIIKKSDIADFIMLESTKTGHTADMSFFMPGISGPVITTFGCFLNKANPVFREEIIDRLVLLQTTDTEPKNIKVFDTDTFFDMVDNNEISNDIKNFNKLYQKYA